MDHMKTDQKEIFWQVKIKIVNTIWFYFESWEGKSCTLIKAVNFT